MGKLKKIRDFIVERLSEASTWNGIKLIVSLAGIKTGADLDWGPAAFIGVILYGLIKIASPDKKSKKDV